MRNLRAEAHRASPQEAKAYLIGASRDGTFNRLHNTLRISQRDARWLQILQVLFARLGSRSWTYQEGKRNVWVIETTCRLDQSAIPSGDLECAAFARGYFDAEGGVPRDPRDRFYVQFGQKDYGDLARLRGVLAQMGLECGRLHNPSARADPDYWILCANEFSRGVLEQGWFLAPQETLDPRRQDADGSVARYPTWEGLHENAAACPCAYRN
jgi:hypothetical protein